MRDDVGHGADGREGVGVAVDEGGRHEEVAQPAYFLKVVFHRDVEVHLQFLLVLLALRLPLVRVVVFVLVLLQVQQLGPEVAVRLHHHPDALTRDHEHARESQLVRYYAPNCEPE